MNGGRSVYLTATKSLQDQLSDDFSPCGMVDMRGRQNYDCVEGNGSRSCTEGRIRGCRNGGCPYQANRAEFLKSKLGLSNYSYYLSSVLHSEGVGDVNLLILDEAHAAVQELSSAIEIHLNHRLNFKLYDILDSRPPYSLPLAGWRTWAKFTLPKAQFHLKKLKESDDDKHLALVDQYVSTLERMSNVPEDWILDTSSQEETVISPLWPTDYADKYLFKQIPRVLLVSATIVPKTLQLLGIKPEQSLFLSQDHTFDPDRCPVYLMRVCKVDYRMGEGEIQDVVGCMDTIIRQRSDRKGIIHTTSYDRQNQIYNRSEHQDIIIAPKKASELKAALEEFKASSAPRILMSPAVTTGYDFPYSDCEYQILLKVPFIDARSPVMKARSEADKEYLPYMTAQTLTQTCGRAMRAPDDRVENFIMDTHASWFLKKHRDLFPPWFMRQIRYPDGLPSPPPPLNSS
jgi:Rad3-related DNA helicase